ncbi:NAD(P)H-hydrate dehydratase [Paracoccus sp. PARArs4]|uniref:NAD(P)H-hydrate dehydratase n=1 Tax=Paracoccus sp. PARArs4 TaxID=2853442 RepID=UPI0024A6EB71|nr:NAD(P)H-hydrate dehydratase [Paracoccus sp. PARArs4]
MLDGTEILTSAQMRAIESDAMRSGDVSGDELMERAGRAVAGRIRLRWPRPGRVTVLAGPGNNGGDGFVVARLLQMAGWQVRVMCDAPKPSTALRRWQAIGATLPFDPDALDPRDLLVDALFGTGLTRAPEGVFATLIRKVRDFPDIVAIDAPSGLCMDSGRVLGDHAPRAAMTVAFHRPKPGHLLADGPAHCGALFVEDIGLAATGPSCGLLLRGRSARTSHWLRKEGAGAAHKYGHGSALVIAGAAAGAARLTARAALRVGAGLVTICPARDAMADHAGPPDALMRKPLEDAADLRDLLDGRVGAVALGPGAGIERAAALLPALLESNVPCVLDADALTALSREGAPAPHPRCILTPHMGEFARLCPDLAERLKQAPERGPAFSKLDATQLAARRLNATVLLKGPDTVIAAPDGRVGVHSDFALPWLATAGAGDALAGIVIGLAARGLDPFEAASLGAQLHADAARHFGPGMIADDIPEMLPHVIR